MFHSRECTAPGSAVTKDSISIKVLGKKGMGSAPTGLGKGKRGGAPPFLQKSFPSPPVFLQRLFFQTVFAHLPVQRGAADAEGKGRLTDVPAKTDEGGGDGLPLDVLKRRLRRGGRGGLRFSMRSAIPKCSGNNAPPSARCTARSTALSNCRILPGHG